MGLEEFLNVFQEEMKKDYPNISSNSYDGTSFPRQLFIIVNNKHFTPITYVCYKKKGDSYPEYLESSAIKQLQLRRQVADLIVCSSHLIFKFNVVTPDEKEARENIFNLRSILEQAIKVAISGW